MAVVELLRLREVGYQWPPAVDVHRDIRTRQELRRLAQRDEGHDLSFSLREEAHRRSNVKAVRQAREARRRRERNQVLPGPQPEVIDGRIVLINRDLVGADDGTTAEQHLSRRATRNGLDLARAGILPVRQDIHVLAEKSELHEPGAPDAESSEGGVEFRGGDRLRQQWCAEPAASADRRGG